ncbi:MAG: hypothetical protein F6J93_04490 [Oscillatoria sp. SIO1A7]|nr:hypothetical protein [Oscillatoria sp. SIO1A7]
MGRFVWGDLLGAICLGRFVWGDLFGAIAIYKVSPIAGQPSAARTGICWVGSRATPYK